MAVTNTNSSTGETKTFLVQCNECAFEKTVHGREAATATGTTHSGQTEHDIIAVEVPP